jgi:hypothetical protein
MQSAFTPVERKESPEQVFQQSLEQKTKLKQEISRIETVSQALNTMSPEQQRTLYARYQTCQQAMQSLDQTLNDLTRAHPELMRLIPVAGLPSGAMTGDHVPQSAPSSPAAASSSSTFQNPNAFFTNAFDPGVVSQSSQQKRTRPKGGKRR